jgi:hypothetical protein
MIRQKNKTAGSDCQEQQAITLTHTVPVALPAAHVRLTFHPDLPIVVQ